MTPDLDVLFQTPPTWVWARVLELWTSARPPVSLRSGDGSGVLGRRSSLNRPEQHCLDRRARHDARILVSAIRNGSLGGGHIGCYRSLEIWIPQERETCLSSHHRFFRACLHHIQQYSDGVPIAEGHERGNHN